LFVAPRTFADNLDVKEYFASASTPIICVISSRLASIVVLNLLSTRLWYSALTLRMSFLGISVNRASSLNL